MIYHLTDNDLKKASAVLRIQGPDANSFLQGQFTQDLKQAEKAPIYGLWLDLKGKVLADSWIIRLGDNDYRVVSFSVTATVLMARLEAFLIADEVELRDETSQWSSVLVWSEKALPEMKVPLGTWVFRSRRAAPCACEILVSAANASTLVLPGEPATHAEAELARLRAGFPSVPADIGPRDLPAEGALDDVAISFTKGCYLGQEVIARLKNLGQVRRALHVITGAGAPPAAGAALHQGERKVGEVRSGAADGDTFLAMAMLSLVNLDPAKPLGLAPGGGGIKILRRV